MRFSKLSKFELLLILAIISCSQIERDNPLDPEGVAYDAGSSSSSSSSLPNSSSSFGSSSSSSVGVYCLIDAGELGQFCNEELVYNDCQSYKDMGYSVEAVSSCPKASSSSSGTPPPSSSSAAPNAYQPSAFTCTWDPASVVVGQSARVTITLNAADAAAACSEEVYAFEKGVGWSPDVTYDITAIAKTGIEPVWGATIGNGIKWPAEPAGSSVSTGETIKAKVTCSGGGKSPGSRTQDCPLTISKSNSNN